MRNPIYLIIFLLINLNAYSQDSISPEKIKVYKSLKKALKHPERVRALDLSGQKLKQLPKEIGELQNLEFLWLGSKLRNLWFYPKAWPYKFFGKNLPAGGYAHLQGRGGGIFIYQNHIDSLPDEFYKLKKLKYLNAELNKFANPISIMNLKTWNTQLIIISSAYESWDVAMHNSYKAMVLFRKYKFKKVSRSSNW